MYFTTVRLTDINPKLKQTSYLMDNASTQPVDGVEEAIEARGTRVFYLPSRSPDFNPIWQNDGAHR
jgi:transposase